MDGGPIHTESGDVPNELFEDEHLRYGSKEDSAARSSFPASAPNRKTRGMDNMAILLGTPPRLEGQGRPQMPRPPGGGGFRSRLNVKETTRRSRTDIALGAGYRLPGDHYG